MTEAIVAPIGHNGGPALEESPRPRNRTIRTQWAKALFAHPRTPDHVIAMCWAIHWYSKDDGSGAALSNEQFTAMCGVSDRNVSRGKSWLLANGFVTIRVGRSGQKTTFQMTIPDTVIQPEEPNSIRQCGGLEPVLSANVAPSVRQDGALEPAKVAALENSIRQNMGGNPPIRRPVGRQDGALIQESNQDIIQEEEKGADAPTIKDKVDPKASAKTSQSSGKGFWQAAFAPKEPEPHDDVLFKDGAIVLLNGARSEWLLQFQGDEEDLNLALIEIAPEIQANSNVPVKAQVARKLAQMTRKRREQDKRYAAAAASKAAKPSSRTEDAAARRERIRQHAIEAAEAFERNRGRQ